MLIGGKKFVEPRFRPVFLLKMGQKTLEFGGAEGPLNRWDSNGY